MVGQPLPDQPRGDVDAAARGKTRDDLHRPRRIIQRGCRAWQDRRGSNGGRKLQEFSAAKRHGRPKPHSTSSGHGTMVDFTVFIVIASATAWPMPASVNG